MNGDTTDILEAKGDLYDKNLFAYCDNNPVARVDYGGEFWDTVLDVISLAISVSEVINNPTSGAAWAGLAADAVCTVVPGLTGGGIAVKAVTKADDAVDVVKAVSKADDVVDTAKAVKATKKIGRSGKQARLRELANDDKLSSALRGEIKRDINMIKRGQRTTIRVPYGYHLSHRIGFSANKGYSYAYSDLQIIATHRTHHRIFGWR